MTEQFRYTLIGCAFGFVLLAITMAPPKALRPVVTGEVEYNRAVENRVKIEDDLAKGPVTLPPGLIALDRALTVPSGSRLSGNGPSTVLRNLFTHGGTYSRTVLIHGSGIGYADYVKSVVTPTVVEVYPWDAFGSGDAHVAQARPGDVVWAFNWDEFVTRKPPRRERYAVKSVDKSDRTKPHLVEFDRKYDPELTRLKWANGVAIKDVKAGGWELNLEDKDHVGRFKPGDLVYVSGGPFLGHECYGEYRRILSVDGQAEVVRLDRPLRRAYDRAALVVADAVRDVVISDLVVGNAVGAGTSPILVKFACDVRLVRVGIGDLILAAPVSEFASSGRLTFIDSAFDGGVLFNTCHDVILRGGRFFDVRGEEGVIDLCLSDAHVGRPGWSYGIFNHLQCDFWTVRNVRVGGMGHNIGVGHGSPLFLQGRGNVVRDFTAYGSHPASRIHLPPDTIVDNLTSDVPR